MIADVAYDVIIGRDFLQKFRSKIDFESGVGNFSPEADLLPFCGTKPQKQNLTDDVSERNFVCSVHANDTFVIPPESEIVVLAKLNSSPNNIAINGLLAPRTELLLYVINIHVWARMLSKEFDAMCFRGSSIFE